jgi:hypothetical protein
MYTNDIINNNTSAAIEKNIFANGLMHCNDDDDPSENVIIPL